MKGNQPSGLMLLTSSSLRNKGDALMLRAIEARLGRTYRYALPSNVSIIGGQVARRYITCLSVDRPPVTSKRFVFNACVLGAALACSLLRERDRRKIGVALPKDVSAVLDVSGYCYGDPWGQALLEHSAKQYLQYKKRGVPVILMPKTWGPFEKIRHATVRQLVDTVDLVFARDPQSHEHLIRCLGLEARGKVHIAPDYTHAITTAIGRPTGGVATGRGEYLIIPSYRVIDSGCLTKAEYFELIGYSRQFLEDNGKRVCLLIHEYSSDQIFAKEASSLGFEDRDVLSEECPEALKALIARSDGVITSRLHGLYNALNSSIPVVVIPWSFKYAEALRQYNCEEALVDLSAGLISLRQKLRQILDPSIRKRMEANMVEGRERVMLESEIMWEKILRSLSPSSGFGSN